MKKSKRILTVLLCAAMVMAFVPAVSVSAEEYSGTCGDNVTWSLNTNTGVLTISGTGDMNDYDYYWGNVPWGDYRESIKSVVIKDGVTNIGMEAFRSCSNLKAVTIPNSVTSIRYGAFEACGLESITIPGSVTNIVTYAFRSCFDLTSVTMLDGVTTIGDCVFEYCSALTNITIPDSVTTIGEDAFCNTAYYSDESNWEDGVLYIDKHLIKAQETIDGDCVIKDGTLTIANSAFTYSSVMNVIIPYGVRSIGDYAFRGCRSMTSVTIPESVTSIGYYTFSYCTSLTSVTIPDSVTSIDYAAFASCEALENITIPGSVTNISASMFSGCFNLESATILDGVTSIGDSVFAYCSSLASVELPDSVQSIGGQVFDDTAYYNDESNWENGTLYIGKHLIRVQASIEGDYVIKSGTLSIAGYALQSCGVTNVTIPDSVLSIGDYAFGNCYNLTNITIPDSVTSIGWYAFYYCTALKSVMIGDGVTDLGYYSFYGCSELTSVAIGKSVMCILYYTFSGCTAIKDVYYGGSEEDWVEIYIFEEGNGYFTSATIHYNCVTMPMKILLSGLGKYAGVAEAEVVVGEDGEASVALTITDSGVLSAENVTAFAVSYSGGVVKEVNEMTKTITSGGADFAGSVSGSYRIFIWDENMCPVTESVG